MAGVILIVMVLAALLSGSAAAERHQDAMVRTAEDGRPCFSVDADAEASKNGVRVAVVELYERREGRANLIWESDFLSDQRAAPKQVDSNECIEYPEGSALDASVLREGEPYSVTIWAFVDSNGESHRRWYSGYFCMVKVDGELRPRQVLWDRNSSVWNWDVCGSGMHW